MYKFKKENVYFHSAKLNYMYFKLAFLFILLVIASMLKALT